MKLDIVLDFWTMAGYPVLRPTAAKYSRMDVIYVQYYSILCAHTNMKNSGFRVGNPSIQNIERTSWQNISYQLNSLCPI